MEDIYLETAQMLKAISDPKRLKIVDMLSCRAQCANKLQEAFSVTQPTLSHDMKVLLEAGLVIDKRDGKHIYYSLNPEGFKKLQSIMGDIFRHKKKCLSERKVMSEE